MRQVGIAAFWLSLAAIVGTLALGGSARAGLRLQDATPVAGTPVAVPANSSSPFKTLVAWYAPDASTEFLVLTPLTTDPGLVAAPTAVATGQQPGRADFPAEGLPTMTFGDTTFTAYSPNPDEPGAAYRWSWFDAIEEKRPATLVLQVTGSGGAYEGYVGTATFISRGQNAGGVLVLLVGPADAIAAETPAADAAVDDAPTDVPVEEVPVEETPVADAALDTQARLFRP
jgi:hypothetical protein